MVVSGLFCRLSKSLTAFRRISQIAVLVTSNIVIADRVYKPRTQYFKIIEIDSVSRYFTYIQQFCQQFVQRSRKSCDDVILDCFLSVQAVYPNHSEPKYWVSVKAVLLEQRFHALLVGRIYWICLWILFQSSYHNQVELMKRPQSSCHRYIGDG